MLRFLRASHAVCRFKARWNPVCPLLEQVGRRLSSLDVLPNHHPLVQKALKVIPSATPSEVVRFYQGMMKAKRFPNTDVVEAMLMAAGEKDISVMHRLFKEMRSPPLSFQPRPETFGILFRSCKNKPHGVELAVKYLKLAEEMELEHNTSHFVDILEHEEVPVLKLFARQFFGRNSTFPITQSTVVSFLQASKGKKGGVKFAADIIKGMKTRNIARNAHICTAHLSVLSEAEEWEQMDKEFELMQRSGVRATAHTFNVLLHACALRENGDKLALELLDQMEKEKIEPNVYCFTSAMKAVLESAEKLEGVLGRMLEKEIAPNNWTADVLLKACTSFPDGVDRAVLWFEKLRECGVEENARLYTMMIEVCCAHANMGLALQYLREMVKQGFKPTIFVFTHLMKCCLLYAEDGLTRAEKVVQLMNETGVRLDTVALNTLVCLYCESGLIDEAKTIVKQHEGSVVFDSSTFNPIVRHVGFSPSRPSSELAELVESVFHAVQRPDAQLGAAFITAYLKRGLMEEAMKILNKFRSNLPSDIVMFNEFLQGLDEFPSANEDAVLTMVQQLLKTLQENKNHPDRNTFAATVKLFARKDFHTAVHIKDSAVRAKLVTDLCYASLISACRDQADGMKKAEDLWAELCALNDVTVTSVALASLYQVCKGKPEKLRWCRSEAERLNIDFDPQNLL